jgi:hypothetical protein
MSILTDSIKEEGPRKGNIGTTREQIARLVYFTIKAKFELISTGARTFEQEFLGDLLTGDGATVFQALEHCMAQREFTYGDIVRAFPVALGGPRA